MSDKKNPCVFLDLSIDGSPAERIVFELFAHVLPKTAENFRALCTGEGIAKPLHYKGTVFSQIYKGVFAHGGEFPKQGGAGEEQESIFEGVFEDEDFKPKMVSCGMLTVGPWMNGSKFFLILDRVPNLYGDVAVFGKVIEGKETVLKIDELGTREGEPSGEVKITNCGEISEEDKKKYVLACDKVKKKKATKERAKPSNYASEFYSSRRKYSWSNKSTDSDSELYSSLLVKIRDWPEDKNNNVMESDTCLAASDFKDESTYDGRVRKKQPKRRRMRSRSWSPESAKVYASIVVNFHACDISEDGTGKRAISSDESSDDPGTDCLWISWPDELSNTVLEFYYSKRKYRSDSRGVYSCQLGKNSESDSELYPLKMGEYRVDPPKSSISYSSD